MDDVAMVEISVRAIANGYLVSSYAGQDDHWLRSDQTYAPTIEEARALVLIHFDQRRTLAERAKTEGEANF